MNTPFKPTRTLISSVFAAVALVATFSTGAFIDALARGYSTAGQQVSNAHPVLVAAAQR